MVSARLDLYLADLYNHVALEKKKKIEGSDAQFMLNYMIA